MASLHNRSPSEKQFFLFWMTICNIICKKLLPHGISNCKQHSSWLLHIQFMYVIVNDLPENTCVVTSWEQKIKAKGKSLLCMVQLSLTQPTILKWPVSSIHQNHHLTIDEVHVFDYLLNRKCEKRIQPRLKKQVSYPRHVRGATHSEGVLLIFILSKTMKSNQGSGFLISNLNRYLIIIPNICYISVPSK